MIFIIITLKTTTYNYIDRYDKCVIAEKIIQLEKKIVKSKSSNASSSLQPTLLEKWIEEFTSHVSRLKPDFVALHLQEVGGKTYEKSMEYVQQFIKMLCEAKEFEDFDRIRVYLDEDYNSAEHFTVST